ncbi:MAG TPA: DNA polymerase III subunit beta [Acidimicrobiales bacterium]|nr:DNA polymerase III subunit beta [Acidimicrobiales bacterium]
MKFRCERDTLVEALGIAGRAVATRGGALPVLSGVRMEVVGNQLRLAGSDLDLTIQVDAEVNGIEDGVNVLPARLATDIVRALEPGAVTFETGDEDVRITAGRSQFSVRILPTDEFPRLPFPAEAEGAMGDAVTLSGAAFAEALRQVVRAASSDDSLPVISGVLMTAESDGLRLVATDRYRLAVRDLPGTSVLREGQQVLVPSRALSELQRLLSGADEVTLRLGERDASFEVGRVRLTTRLIEGEFPPYQRLIPESYPNRLIVGKEALLDAVRRVRLLVKDAITPVRVTLRPDGVECTVVTQEVGQATEDLDAKYEGGEMVMGFNPTFLIDGLEAVTGDEVALETLDPMKPATLRSTDGGEYLYLLMPVRLTG